MHFFCIYYARFDKKTTKAAITDRFYSQHGLVRFYLTIFSGVLKIM